MTKQLVILGGEPTFSEKINIVKPLLPQYSNMKNQVRNILMSGMVTKGKYLEEFENSMSEHLHVDYVVAVSSCTSGLMLVYKCLGLAGEVIVPSYTFMATISSLVWSGLKPIFVDVDYETANIDLRKIETLISDKTCAIVGVHNFGNPVNINGLVKICEKYGLTLIFDAAHALGSLYQGVPVGSQGKAQVFSLSPTKLVIAGEGGVVVTNDSDLANDLRIGREYGNDGQYNSKFAGLNARMPELSALMACKSLKLLDQSVIRRNKIAELYIAHLSQIPGIRFQSIKSGNRSSYKDFTLFIDEKEFGLSRNILSKLLLMENIDTRKYYDPPVHKHEAYKQYDSNYNLQNTELLSKTCLSLPIWSQMSNNIVKNICSVFKRIYNNQKSIKDKINEQ